jgi:hypothetical protein
VILGPPQGGLERRRGLELGGAANQSLAGRLNEAVQKQLRRKVVNSRAREAIRLTAIDLDCFGLVMTTSSARSASNARTWSPPIWETIRHLRLDTRRKCSSSRRSQGYESPRPQG